MTFNGEYFQQIFRVIMGTNVAPILANIYLAKLEKLLLENVKQTKNSFGQFCSKDLLTMVLVLQWVIKKNLNTGYLNSIH